MITKYCYNCKKKLIVGVDVFFSIDISYKGFYGNQILRGDVNECHAVFCDNCGKAAEKLFDKIKIPKIKSLTKDFN